MRKFPEDTCAKCEYFKKMLLCGFFVKCEGAEKEPEKCKLRKDVEVFENDR